MCILLYLTGLTLVLLNLAGIGDHSFDRKSLECIWDRMATYYYTVAFSVLLVWIPVTITGIFYLKIYISVRTSTKKITEVTCSNHNRKAIKLARTLFFIYMIFSSCWIPYALIIVVDRNDTFPYESHLILTAFGHLHPSINWLIYYFTNTKFRKAFDELVKLNKLFDLCKAKKKVEAEICFLQETWRRKKWKRKKELKKINAFCAFWSNCSSSMQHDASLRLSWYICVPCPDRETSCQQR